MSIFEEVRGVYRDSRKARDVFWNVWVARPLAAALIVLLRGTPITPNQVTFLGLAVFAAAAAVLVCVPGWAGFVVGAAVIELSYLLDCADGQLARLKGMTSKVGAYLDFLVDEVKALLLVGAMSLRLWRVDGDLRWLLVGLAGVALVAMGTSLTTFVRRPEYAGEEQAPGVPQVDAMPAEGGLKVLVWGVMRGLRWIVHYPSWIVYLALLDGHPAVDGPVVFLIAYLGAYALYVGRTGLGVVVRLGRPAFYAQQEPPS